MPTLYDEEMLNDNWFILRGMVNDILPRKC